MAVLMGTIDNNPISRIFKVFFRQIALFWLQLKNCALKI